MGTLLIVSPGGKPANSIVKRLQAGGGRTTEERPAGIALGREESQRGLRTRRRHRGSRQRLRTLPVRMRAPRVRPAGLSPRPQPGGQLIPGDAGPRSGYFTILGHPMRSVTKNSNKDRVEQNIDCAH